MLLCTWCALLDDSEKRFRLCGLGFGSQFAGATGGSAESGGDETGYGCGLR